MKELCLDFINTRWYLTHKINKEILADPELLKEFLESHQLHIDSPISIDIINDLMELRAFLAKNLEDYMRERLISSEAIKRINYYLAISTCIRVMEKRENGFSLAIRPNFVDWNWVMAEITASFVELLESGDYNRIKLCENPECKWFFYDETKSRTKRWCDDRCASLMKVRKFRSKQKNILNK